MGIFCTGEILLLSPSRSHPLKTQSRNPNPDLQIEKRVITILQLNNTSQVFLKRTLRPTYALTQATPKSGFLDPNWNRSVPIWPGMAMMKTTGVAYPENAQSYASVSTTLTSGSNGVNVNTFTGAGTVNVASSANFANSGSVQVATSTGQAVITYTGSTGTTLTGAQTVYGTGTLATGGVVTQQTDIIAPPSYTATGFPTGSEAAFTLVNMTGIPQGLCANYIGGDGMDELITQGVNATAVWVLGPDAEMEVDAPAFDPTMNWATADPGTGVDVLIYARGANLAVNNGLNGIAGALNTYGLQGQLVLSSDANKNPWPVAKLISVNTTTSITIGGLAPVDVIGSTSGALNA